MMGPKRALCRPFVADRATRWAEWARTDLTAGLTIAKLADGSTGRDIMPPPRVEERGSGVLDAFFTAAGEDA